jgi:hypothetical protein
LHVVALGWAAAGEVARLLAFEGELATDGELGSLGRSEAARDPRRNVVRPRTPPLKKRRGPFAEKGV